MRGLRRLARLKCRPHVNTRLAFRPGAGLPRRHSPQVPAAVCPIIALAPKRAFPLQTIVLFKGSPGHIQGFCQLNLAECGLMSRFREGTSSLPHGAEVRKDHRAVFTRRKNYYRRTVVALALLTWLRSIVTATGAD